MAARAPEPPPDATRRRWAREQARLQARVVEEDTEEWQKAPGFAGLERVGGVDLSYTKGEDGSACASLVVLSYPGLEVTVLYEDCRMVAVSAPYVAGFLAFREVPFLVEALQRLQQDQPRLRPQVLLVDGNGLLHPRGFGVACHLGVLTDLPCIGVAKNLLQVDGLVRDELHREQIRSLQRGGDTFPLTGTSGKVLGMGVPADSRAARQVLLQVPDPRAHPSGTNPGELKGKAGLEQGSGRLIFGRGSIFGSSCVHHWRSNLVGQRAEKKRLNWLISLMMPEEPAGPLFTGSSPTAALSSATAECHPRADQCKATAPRAEPLCLVLHLRDRSLDEFLLWC
ncbi:LOW QUALITY PROTEIN: endonuclease V [Aegotheles albertisi]